jgi:hypothetical protein
MLGEQQRGEFMRLIEGVCGLPASVVRTDALLDDYATTVRCLRACVHLHSTNRWLHCTATMPVCDWPAVWVYILTCRQAIE